MTTQNLTDPLPAFGTGLVAETLATIDALITRAVTLSHEAARLKQTLADLGAEQKLRKAVLALGVEGKNETERQARLRLELCSDADARRLAEAERVARRRLVETATALWATQKRLAVCLALLKLAADAEADADGAAGGAAPTHEEGER